MDLDYVLLRSNFKTLIEFKSSEFIFFMSEMSFLDVLSELILVLLREDESVKGSTFFSCDTPVNS